MKSLKFKCLGAAEHFLGMRISYTDDAGYAIDQEQSIVKLLHTHGMEPAKAVRASIVDESSLESESGSERSLRSTVTGRTERPTVQWFQSLVGSLLWIACCSRLDIAYAVHRATHLTHAPTDRDLKIAKRNLW